MTLGTRGLGVFVEGRRRNDGREGDAGGFAGLEDLLKPALGVANGEPECLVGDERVLDIAGLEMELGNAPLVLRMGLSARLSIWRELSCCAVIDMYFEALEPSVIFSDSVAPFCLATGVFKPRLLARAIPGVDLPVEEAGVRRPPVEGVALPLE